MKRLDDLFYVFWIPIEVQDTKTIHHRFGTSEMLNPVEESRAQGKNKDGIRIKEESNFRLS
jgi:hypothetical protein